VSKGILDYDDYVPVVKTNNTIIRPYYDSGISIVLKYYDVLASEEDQQNSLIQYDGTYIQSNGVAYSKGNPFDVISILDGTVKEVRQDDIVGNIIVIEHSNGYISTYESIDNIAVEAGMPVVQGQVIAKSATSNISKNLDNHLYFELTKDGENVNPEVYYNKTINE
jgi:stage II sporulation protein Q